MTGRDAPHGAGADRPGADHAEGDPTTAPVGRGVGRSVDRRTFLDLFLKGAGCYAVVATVPFASACADGEESSFGGDAPPGSYRFPQGVASGDPSPESVVLWTRVEAVDGDRASVPLRLEVALDAGFTTLVAERTVQATADSDHTVRVIVQGLEPDTRYFYRFRAGADVTPLTGRTRTAPAPDADRPVRLAFASCQSYEAGWYDAWRHLVAVDEAAPDDEQLDFVLHLGDFIYEALGYGAARRIDPLPSGGGQVGEGAEWASSHAVTLDDYRHLWKTYLADPDLQVARARFPFVMTWDDHEFTDDAWQTASTYGGPSVPAQERKVAANQAWFEFVPAHLSGWRGTAGVASQAKDFEAVAVANAPFAGSDETGLDTEPNNRAALDTLTIYRSQRWGRHVDLVVTDLRSYRTEHAVPVEVSEALGLPARYVAPVPLVRVMDLGRDVPGGAPATVRLGEAELPNPRAERSTGTLLGPRQKAWFEEVTAGSDATWRVLANSVPMMPMRLDLDRLDPARPPAVLTTDTWDGYQAERREVLEHLARTGKRNVISLSGDNHNSFAGRLFRDFEAAAPEAIGAEFSIAGISSPSVFAGFAGYLQPEDPLRPLIVWDGPAGPEPALNLTFTHGTVASATLAETGDVRAAAGAANPSQNPHLAYVDSDAYGIGIATLDGAEARVEMITFPAPVVAPDEGGVTPLRTARFRVPVPVEGEPTVLEGPEIEGRAPFPLDRLGSTV